eukprot:72973_1
MRFHGDHIRKILPNFFVENNENKNFGNTQEAKGLEREFEAIMDDRKFAKFYLALKNYDNGGASYPYTYNNLRSVVPTMDIEYDNISQPNDSPNKTNNLNDKNNIDEIFRRYEDRINKFEQVICEFPVDNNR